MKLRKFSFLLTLMLIIGLIPLTAFASATISVDVISKIHPGDAVTLSGTSTFSEVIVKVVRPSNSIVFYDIVKVADNKFSTSFTLGSNEAAGTYKIVAGQGNDVDVKDLVVEAIVAPGNSNADLSGLTLSSGSLNPTFAPGTTAYTASVANNVSSLTIRASVSDSNASMTVNGIAVASGQVSSAINLIVGTNAMSVVVTAQNGATKTYLVAVTRAAAGDGGDGGVVGGGGDGGVVVGGGVSTSTSTLTTPVISTDGTLTLPAGRSGKVSLGNEITVSIPSGATNKELKLTIEKVLDTKNLLTDKDVLASPIFEILKNFSENFSKPVTLTFTFDPTKLSGNQTVAVFYFDEAKKVWVEVPDGKVKTDTITVEVNHFTKYAVFVVGEAINFSDISGHWAEASIKEAVNGGIVTGYPDGTFKPGKTVTRAEFAVMLMNMLKPQGEGAALAFTDTAKIGAWAQKSVALAVQAGIIKGYEDGSFRPNAEITRAEMALMITKALDLPSGTITATGFADDKDIPAWAKGSVASMMQAGIVQGKGDNKFAPQDHATRAEAVTVLLKMLAQMSK